MTGKSTFFEELKRRHVWRVAIAYAVGAWLIVQIATQVFPFFHVPGWAVRLVVILLVIGCPVALIWAWVFELTPEGVRRTAPAASPQARPEHEYRSVGRKLDLLIVVLLVLAIGVAGWSVYAVHHVRAPARTAAAPSALPATSAAASPAKPAAVPTIPAKSIAVLPFENLSTDKANAYFADGMQDLILTKLAGIGDLVVISRTSTMRYGSHPGNLRTIAGQLGVATILEGSVQKAGNQVLINVQLINAATDAHLWAHSYTRTLDNIFGVEGEVAAKIASALNAKLSPAQSAQLAAVPTTNRAAYDAFLRAEHQANRASSDYSTASIKAALKLYGQAIASDPKFALAYARRSFFESDLAWFGGGGENVKQLFANARADAQRALQLQPDLAAGLVATGYGDYYGRADYAGALKAFNAALALRPNDAGALAARAYVERRQGRFKDALASLQQAMVHDPRNGALAGQLGITSMMTNQFKQAEGWFQRALALDPKSVNARYFGSSAILCGSGDIGRALAMAQGDAANLKGQRVSLLVYQRKYREAIALFKTIPDTPDNFSEGWSKAGGLADLYRLAGDAAKARPLFAKGLPIARAALGKQQGINLAFVWANVADAELGLGHTQKGLEAVAKSLAIADKIQDFVYGGNIMRGNAAYYAEARRPDLAVPLLAKALATPGVGQYYAPVMLWLDPAWDPIRTDPPFQALQRKYAAHKPAVIYAAPPSSSS